MARRHGIASVGVSAAIALLVLWHLVPRDLPAPPVETAAPPVPAEAPATPKVALAPVTLPPPPAPPPPPAAPTAEVPMPAEATVPAGPSLRAEPVPPPPVSVAPLRPTGHPPVPHPPAPPSAVTPLQPGPEAPSAPAAPVEETRREPVTIDPMKVAPPPAAEAKAVPPDPAPTKPAPTKPAPAPAMAELASAAPASAAPAPSAPAAGMPVVGVEDAAPAVATGRPLLRLLEHGEGPNVDIAWPGAAAEREALFRTFERCYGMLVALIAGDGSLFSDLSETAPWAINLDRYSGFVRRSGGLATPGEGDWARRIVRRHPQSAGASIVRVFPRAMDALLVGGLRQLVGPGYRDTRTIRAEYRRDGSAVFIERIHADGAPVAGRIALGAAAERRCRGREAT